jgi:hypothetical protein
MKTKGCKMCGKLEAIRKLLRIEREEAERSLAALGMRSMPRAGLGLSAGVLADSHFGTSPQVNQFVQKEVANISGFLPSDGDLVLDAPTESSVGQAIIRWRTFPTLAMWNCAIGLSRSPSQNPAAQN